MIAPRGKKGTWVPAIKILVSAGRSCASVLLIVLTAALPLQVSAQSEPYWVSPTALASTDGVAILKWSVTGDDPIALFRVTEEHAGARQVSYTDQPELQVLRTEQGKYIFLVQACTRLADGYPQCGEVSRTLVLTVAGAADDKERMRSPGKTAGNKALQAGDAAAASAAVAVVANAKVGS